MEKRGLFQAGGFIEEAEVSIGFMDVPGAKFTIELMCYHKPEGRKEPIIFKAKQAADILGNTKYFYFIDKYGLQWEFEQGYTDIGDCFCVRGNGSNF